ncbi:MAG: hypothetical protein KJ667_08350, partial [Alphaproteobacteria bacterium]|nr:hypothetical protein [Alphaproteobacteria bacterium]
RAAMLAAPSVIAACSADLGPGPMPTGYAHHKEMYKAQPGPRPVLMKDHMLANQEKEVRAYHPNGGGAMGGHDMGMPMMHTGSSWDMAATDLVSRLVNELGKPMETVYVVPGNYPDLEQALRNAMTGRGIAVHTAPGDGPFTMQYAVQPVTDSSMVSITLMSVGSAVKEVSGIYSIGTAPAVMAAPAMPVETSAPMPIMPMPMNE